MMFLLLKYTITLPDSSTDFEKARSLDSYLDRLHGIVVSLRSLYDELRELRAFIDELDTVCVGVVNKVRIYVYWSHLEDTHQLEFTTNYYAATLVAKRIENYATHSKKRSSDGAGKSPSTGFIDAQNDEEKKNRQKHCRAS